ncbi:hypothetical protein [Microvirga massiliensis]|uniref:hypothetical protein n=1 Tax=Microvirga massiliensis TaxID=1033741 RepID=UPI00164DDE6C|nr:hypothetical protein [Microvirga massiliensis]
MIGISAIATPGTGVERDGVKDIIRFQEVHVDPRRRSGAVRGDFGLNGLKDDPSRRA